MCSKTKLHTNVNIIQKRWRMYETRRDADSVNINAFNPTILRHFRSNMDIQFVNNAESIAYYTCAYICKHEPDELRNALGNLIFNVFVKDPSLTKYKKLWKIGTTVLKHRRLSAQEAAFRMSSNLHMVEQSRCVVYLNVRLPEKRYKMLKTKKELQGMREESTEIFKTNLLDYYRCRPAERDDMSLYYFAAWNSRCSPPKRKTHGKDVIHIVDFDIWFSCRKKAAVVRYPTFVVHSQDYYYSLLLMLLPHMRMIYYMVIKLPRRPLKICMIHWTSLLILPISLSQLI